MMGSYIKVSRSVFYKIKYYKGTIGEADYIESSISDVFEIQGN
jgi:hypothetical protein